MAKLLLQLHKLYSWRAIWLTPLPDVIQLSSLLHCSTPFLREKKLEMVLLLWRLLQCKPRKLHGARSVRANLGITNPVYIVSIIYGYSSLIIYSYYSTTIFCEVGVSAFAASLVVGVVVMTATIVLILLIDRVSFPLTWKPLYIGYFGCYNYCRLEEKYYFFSALSYNLYLDW